MKPAHKGILKHKAEEKKMVEPGQQIRWDEETIADQDKQRGGKMKVTEPKTPYNYYDSVSPGTESMLG